MKERGGRENVEEEMWEEGRGDFIIITIILFNINIIKILMIEFNGPVEHFPFEDHNVPHLDKIIFLSKNISTFLSSHKSNVVAIHCKAGKGRTGLIVCCFLLYSKLCKTAEEALHFYGNK